jgi:hypothetical protein
MIITVECHRCHRPIALLHLHEGRAEPLGTTVAENGDPGGVLTVSVGQRKGRWASQVISTDASVAQDSAMATGRITLAHVSGRCKERQPVTSEARTAAYHRAVAAGKKRISLLDLKV